MGLDVYLYQCDDFDAADKAEDACDAEIDKLYTDAAFMALDHAARNAACNAINLRYGVAEYCHESRRKIEIDSTIKPDHLFKVGYFRSSYNSSGINRILPDGLAGIFGVTSEERWVKPDWRRSRERAMAAIRDLQNRKADPDGRLRASFRSARMLRADSITRTEDEAVARVREAMVEHRARPDAMFGGAYSNAAGEFSLDKPVEVVAHLVGTGILNDPGVWVVYRAPEDWLDWYIQALEIVVETIDYVLANTKHRGTDAEGCEFRFRWSA